MSEAVVLLGDIGTDHDGFHPSPVIAGSQDVWIDGRPVARRGDALAPHVHPDLPPHPRSIAEGDGAVFINHRPIAVSGSRIDCGGKVIGTASVRVGKR